VEKGGALINSLKYFKHSIIVLGLAVSCAACYPKPVGQASQDGKRLTWAEMNLAQRQDHMRGEILPRAASFFGSWRPERYARVDCSLCHGPGYREGNFAMPTAHLPRLSGELLLGPEFAQQPETTRLKLDRLVPLISDGLGVKPFSVVTRSGFGCYSCHLGPTGAMFGN
jgi:hypothetical protein